MNIRVEYSLSGHSKERHFWANYAGNDWRDGVYVLLRSLQTSGFPNAIVWCDNEKFVPTKQEVREYDEFLAIVRTNTEKRRKEPEPEFSPVAVEPHKSEELDIGYLDSLLMDPRNFER